MIAVQDAVALVQENDHLARAGACGRVQIVTLQERLRERQDDQGERRQPHHQEEPVVNPPPPYGLVRDALHEHQRREMHHLLLLALNQMDQHGNGECREGCEEQRG